MSTPKYRTHYNPYIQGTHKPTSQVTPSMRARLQKEVAEQLTSPPFVESCMASFDQLDKNKDGKLSREEVRARTRTHARTHTHTHARTHARMHAREHMQSGSLTIAPTKWHGR